MRVFAFTAFPLVFGVRARLLDEETFRQILTPLALIPQIHETRTGFVSASIRLSRSACADNYRDQGAPYSKTAAASRHLARCCRPVPKRPTRRQNTIRLPR